MKWLVVIVIVLVLAGVVWLRAVRTSPASGGAGAPHRLDDSLSGPDETPGNGPPTS